MNLDALINSLTNEEQQGLFQILQYKISGEKFSLKLDETYFSTGLYCPRCGCIELLSSVGSTRASRGMPANPAAEFSQPRLKHSCHRLRRIWKLGSSTYSA